MSRRAWEGMSKCERHMTHFWIVTVGFQRCINVGIKGVSSSSICKVRRSWCDDRRREREKPGGV